MLFLPCDISAYGRTPKPSLGRLSKALPKVNRLLVRFYMLPPPLVFGRDLTWYFGCRFLQNPHVEKQGKTIPVTLLREEAAATQRPVQYRQYRQGVNMVLYTHCSDRPSLR